MTCSSKLQAMDGSARAPVDQLELEYQHLNVEAASFGVGGLPEYIRDVEMASAIRQLSDKVHGALPRASAGDLEQDRSVSSTEWPAVCRRTRADVMRTERKL